jgi:hypothetical protein
MISAAKFPESASLVKRVAWSLYNGTPTSSPLTISTPPTGSFRCKVTLISVSGHTDCAGTIVVGSETLTFSQAGTKLTTTTLTAKPTVTFANIDCHIHLTALSTSGSDIEKETLTTIDISFDDSRKGYYNEQGIWTVNNSRVLTEDTMAVIGDIIRYTAEGDSASVDYIIKSIQRVKNARAVEQFRVLQF